MSREKLAKIRNKTYKCSVSLVSCYFSITYLFPIYLI